MNENLKIFERLFAYWERQGLERRLPCAPSKIRAFEERERVVLPEDLRHYWHLTDGMSEQIGKSKDREGFSFWPLHRLTRVDKELERHSPHAPLPKDSVDYYAFADYLDWSWAYAIKLRPAELGKVIMIGANTIPMVANSFSQFIEEYLNDSKSLYPDDKDG